MGISFIHHKGVKILYVDYSHCKTQNETIKQLGEVRDFFIHSHEKLTVLNDFSTAPVSNEFIDLAKKYAKDAFDEKTIKSACIGITGIKKILLATFNLIAKNKIAAFDTKEQALDYLVQ